MKVLALILVSLIVCTQVQADRNARLFFATISSSTSTSTTTSTLKTTSICFKSNASLTGACTGKRKKRAAEILDSDEIFPSRVHRTEDMISSSDDAPNYRDARLFLLLTSTSTITATATSTTTSYTATLSVTVACSPTSISLCS